LDNLAQIRQANNANGYTVTAVPSQKSKEAAKKNYEDWDGTKVW
jgi:hypothetical protein